MFLVFTPLYLCWDCFFDLFKVTGELPKNDCRKFFPGKLDKTYYINISNFLEDEYLYFKIIMNHGHFTDDIMIHRRYIIDEYHSGSISYRTSLQRADYDSCSRASSSFTITKNYTTETYYYSVEKNIGKGICPFCPYIIVYSTPGEFYYSDNRSFIEVCNLEKKGISIGIWIGAGALVLVVYILIIILYQYKRAPKQKHIDTTAFKPIVINVSPSTNASNQNN